MKDYDTHIRMTHEQKENIKKYGSTFAEIWELGYVTWIEKIPDLLQKKAEYYQNLWKQCNHKIAECSHNVSTKMRSLEQLKQKYISAGRSIDDPDPMDLSWIESQINKIDGISVEVFFDYCNNRLNDEKQKFLEGIYG